jgi:N-acetylmuramic acid 6-phosphate etherase
MSEPLNLEGLATELRNPQSAEFDALPTLEMLAVMNREDRRTAEAVEAALPRIAEAVDAVTARMRAGGRLFYIGAGTSGRLGVLDASECPPTFNVAPGKVVGLIAGGDHALRNAVEGVEDSREAGAADVRQAGVGAGDALVGIAASGRTPYVLGAMEEAGRAGAAVIGLSCAEGSEVSRAAGIAIELLVGAEVVTGSTRLKAGTATKMALNMLSTGVMVRLGYVYGNLMINVQPKNRKLVDRAERIVMAVSGSDRETAAGALEAAGNHVATAAVMAAFGIDRETAAARLAAADGNVRKVLSNKEREDNGAFGRVSGDRERRAVEDSGS